MKDINFGDCSLRTRGAIFLGEALKNGHLALENLTLDYNEIGVNGGYLIATAVINKRNLHSLDLRGNNFGGEGCKKITQLMKENKCENSLHGLDEDHSLNHEVEKKRIILGKPPSKQIIPKSTLPPTPKKFNCQNCSYTTDDKSNLSRHQKNIHGKNMHQCRKCHRIISGRADSIKRHNQMKCQTIMAKINKLNPSKDIQQKVRETEQKKKKIFENSSKTYENKVEELFERYKKNKVRLEIEGKESRGEDVNLHEMDQHWE